MRGLLIGLLLMAGPAVAQTPEQLQLIDSSIRAFLIERRCPNLEVDTTVLTGHSQRLKLNADDVEGNGRFVPAVQNATRVASPAINGVGESTLCNTLWRSMFGPGGALIENLVKERPFQPKPITAEAPQNTVARAAVPVAPPTLPPAPRVVAGADMQLAPRKWMGQPVEMRRMKCLHADKDEYRCITSDSSTLIIFAETINPPAMKDFVEKSCGTFEEMLRPTCRFTLRFTAQQHGEDTISGYQKRTVIQTAAIEVIREAARRR